MNAVVSNAMSSSIKNVKKDSSSLHDPLQVLNDFYRQIVLIKRSLENKDLEFEVAKHLKKDGAPTDDEMAEVISARLQLWIEKKRKAAHKVLTEKEYSRINETLFVAAALADELFILEIDWRGSKYWQSVLLEESIFHTCFAGERFYQGISMLLNERVLDDQQKSLLAVYFLAMRLGFSGRYRGEPKVLNYIRKKLFNRMSGSFDNVDTLVCPQAYEYLFESANEYRLAPLARWKKMVTQTVLLYLFVSWVAWVSLQGEWVVKLPVINSL
jgi:type VI secretion system protein ImpK